MSASTSSRRRKIASESRRSAVKDSSVSLRSRAIVRSSSASLAARSRLASSRSVLNLASVVPLA
jgi:hypothetical protein